MDEARNLRVRHRHGVYRAIHYDTYYHAAFQLVDYITILELQRYLCSYCLRDIRHKYTLDHIQPLSGGGSHTPDNIQFTCPRCNYAKKQRTDFGYTLPAPDINNSETCASDAF